MNLIRFISNFKSLFNLSFFSIINFLLILLFLQSCQESVPESAAQGSIQNKVKDEKNLHWPAKFNIGTPANPEKIAAWDIDVRPDGQGLPPGKGTVKLGSQVYAQKCAMCHGATGKEGPEDRLVGRVPKDEFPFAEDLESFEYKTIGGYWPYATTLFDYINRSMPQTAPGSLTAEEVYALTAFLLFENQIIPEDLEMNAQSLPMVKMPAKDRFVTDDRQEFKVVH
ncbi:hypothetical protein BH23BAC1_BH23BAC1_33750 [soil metagenome]